MTLAGIRFIKRSILMEINDQILFDTDFTPPMVMRSNTISVFTNGQYAYMVLSKNKFGYKAYVDEFVQAVKPNLDECIQQLVEQLAAQDIY